MGRIMVLTLLLTAYAYGGFEQTMVGVRAQAMGNAFVGLADDAWAVFYNPGGLSQLTKNMISSMYSPGLYGLNELSFAALSFILPIRYGVLGFAARRFGFELYRELTLTLSFADHIS